MVSGGPTKAEIIAVTMDKLGLSSGDVFLDVGSGSGAVSLAASQVASKVIAVDSRAEAVEETRASLEGVNSIVIYGQAPECLEEIGMVDCAFVGGTKNLRDILVDLRGRVRGRVVVNCARVETASEAISILREIDVYKEALLVQVSQGYNLAGGTGFRPLNPVYIVVGDMK